VNGAKARDQIRRKGIASRISKPSKSNMPR
jgi:hypothetical protein